MSWRRLKSAAQARPGPSMTSLRTSKISCAQTTHLSLAKLHREAGLTLLKPSPPSAGAISAAWSRQLDHSRILPSQPPPSGATCWLRHTTTPPTRYRHLRAKLPHPLGSIPLWTSRNGRGCAALACYRSCGGGNDVIVAHREPEAVRKPARGSMFQSRTI